MDAQFGNHSGILGSFGVSIYVFGLAVKVQLFILTMRGVSLIVAAWSITLVTCQRDSYRW